MDMPRIVRRLRPVVQSVIAKHLRNAETVVREDPLATFRLDGPMRLDVPPATDGLLVLPERERQDLAGRDETLEALDRDEALHLLQLRPQQRRGIEVGALLVRVRLRFENDGDHVGPPGSAVSMQYVPSTGVTNVRSSRRMKRCACAAAKFARPSGSALS